MEDKGARAGMPERARDAGEELRQALLAFQRTYNETWIIQRHGYRTPAQVRQDQEAEMQIAA